MGTLATLTLFPPHSLDTSILVAVMVGVFLLAFFTETLGWVFVGLVVPGYLASVFIIHPEAGFTVTGEAILTWLLAVVLSRGISGTGAWSDFFGRERFFLIVIASVLVRAISEVVLLPRIGAYLDLHYGTTFTLDRTLHSIGLVLVPLTANAFWKVGLRRGLFQVGVPVALTWLVLTLVLLPYTNLSFSSLEMTYEDVAQRFLASPKAYILLLTTAVIAARYNLRYGWDFNGILVAALVALTWLGPSKTLATIGEVLILVLVTHAILKLPGVRTFNLEGPRKTVLVFSLGFLLKFAVGWMLGGRIPGLKVTDLFGFGYLVPTLLAVKILQKQVTARVLLPTLHTSLVGVVVGSLIGFPLSLLEPKQAWAEPDPDFGIVSAGLDRTPLGVMALARATCREQDAKWAPIRQRRSDLREFEKLWESADDWLETKGSHALSELREHAENLQLSLERLEPDAHGRDRFALVERFGQGGLSGWGVAILIPGAPGPVLEVPRPASEAPSAEAAALLCERVQCRAILVSGIDTHAAGKTRGDALVERATPFQAAHAALDERERIEIRTDRSLPRGRPLLHLAAEAQTASALWPSALSTHDAPPEPGLNWGEHEVSVLRAHPEDFMALVAGTAPDAPEPTSVPALFSWSTSSPERRAPHFAELPAAELIVLQQQVARPLLDEGPTAAPLELRVRWARAMAALFGMEIRTVTGCGSQVSSAQCLLVSDPELETGRVGASLLVRPHGAPLAVEVPSASRERGTLPLGLETWRSAGARAFLFTDPFVRADVEDANVAAPQFVRTGFQAFHQAIQGALPADRGLVVQVRGYSGRPGLHEDPLVVLDTPVVKPEQRPAEVERLWAAGGPLETFAKTVRYFDGAPELAGLTTPTPQQAYARAFGGPRFVTLWFSDASRGAYLPPGDVETSLAASRITPLPLEPKSPQDALAIGALQPAHGPAPKKLIEKFETLSKAAERLLAQQSVHDLRALAESANVPGVSVRAFTSPEQGLPYLWVEAKEGRRVMRGVYFLQDELPERVRLEAGTESSSLSAELTRALRSRAAVVVDGMVAEGARR